MNLAFKSKIPQPVIDKFPLAKDFFRFSVPQYHQMIQTGILTEEDRVELLDGWIIAKMTHNPPHDGTIQLVHGELDPRLPSGWVIRIQSAITLSASEPEPDLALVRGGVRKFLKAHPRPGDIGKLVEVSESSVLEDREFKGPLYAKEGIPLYWLVNIPERQIEVYSEPKGGRHAEYAKRRDYKPGETIPFIQDGRLIARIPVKALLP